MNGVSFGPAEATHLLTRLQFGVLPDEVETAVQDGLDATLERLLTWQPESEEFETAEAALRSTACATGQIGDLQTWWHYRMIATANPVREKLTLHWHNHFATSYARVRSVPQMAVQNDLFRAQAHGSFRDLLPAVARDPAMLVWLDGQNNRKRHPNENFAREVMELFCLGVGNYTEQDIQEAARAFSGWHLRNAAFWWNESQHDPGEKTIFSHKGRWKGDDVLTFCLDHPACPQFLAYKLLRSFVTASPSTSLLHRTAAAYERHRLETRPVLLELCRSPEFFAPEMRRTMIKSPLEFVLGTLRRLVTVYPWKDVRELLVQLGQAVFEPPSVKGWDGDRQWIQSTGWILRWNFLQQLLQRPFGTFRPDIQSGKESLLADWNLQLLGDRVQPEVLQALEAEWQSTQGQSNQTRVQAYLQLALSLPEYQLM